MRVALYARASTTDQSCEQQLHALRDYVTARGWELAGEYVDLGVSGSKDSRPEMNKLMDAARRRLIDAIAVWKIDRWGRSMPHFVASVQELRSQGVRFISVTQGLDTDESNPTSRLMMHLLAAFSEFERELIVERVQAGLQRARRAGRIGGRPRAVVDRVKIRERSQAGMTVREIAKEFGASPSTICRILRDTSASA